MLRKDDWPEEWPAPVVASGMPDIARAAARGGERLVLLSPPGGALFGGVGWWRALAARARELFPDRIDADVLDCADAPALALTAIRQGQRALILDPASPGFSAVRAIADRNGTRLLARYPDRVAE